MIPVTKTDHRKLLQAITDEEPPIDVDPDAMKFVHKVISGTGKNLLRAYETTKDVRKSIQAVFQQSESLKREVLVEVQRVLRAKSYAETFPSKDQRIRTVLVTHKVPKELIDPIVRDLKDIVDLRDTQSNPEPEYEPVITPVPHSDPRVSMAFTAVLEYLMAELYDAAMDDEDFDGESVTLENVMSAIASDDALAAYISI